MSTDPKATFLGLVKKSFQNGGGYYNNKKVTYTVFKATLLQIWHSDVHILLDVVIILKKKKFALNI